MKSVIFILGAAISELAHINQAIEDEEKLINRLKKEYKKLLTESPEKTMNLPRTFLNMFSADKDNSTKKTKISNKLTKEKEKLNQLQNQRENFWKLKFCKGITNPVFCCAIDHEKGRNNLNLATIMCLSKDVCVRPVGYQVELREGKEFGKYCSREDERILF